jgi:hypothetical protein
MRLFILLMLVPLSVFAKDVQWSQGYTGGCTDPGQRVDGTPLLASEIAKVEYYLDKVDGDIAAPEHTVLMAGGCKDTFIDTKQVGTGTYFAYGRAFDTDGLVSDVSVSVEINITKSRPKSPSGVR